MSLIFERTPLTKVLLPQFDTGKVNHCTLPGDNLWQWNFDEIVTTMERGLHIGLNWLYLRSGMWRNHSRTSAILFFSAVSLACLLLTSGNAWAFDGERKGLVLGAGVGYSPIVNWRNSSQNINETEHALAFEAFAGYAWDNRNMLAIGGLGSNVFLKSAGSVWTFNGLYNLMYRHYVSEDAPSLFLVAGIGLMRFDSENDSVSGHGFGYEAGVGFEISKGTQVELYYAGGMTSDRESRSSRHHLLCVVLTFLAY